MNFTDLVNINWIF